MALESMPERTIAKENNKKKLLRNVIKNFSCFDFERIVYNQNKIIIEKKNTSFKAQTSTLKP
jgi:hypothetical protein